MTGTPLVDLDTPLVGPVGKKAADALAAQLGLHTVGDLCATTRAATSTAGG